MKILKQKHTVLRQNNYFESINDHAFISDSFLKQSDGNFDYSDCLKDFTVIWILGYCYGLNQVLRNTQIPTELWLLPDMQITLSHDLATSPAVDFREATLASNDN